ncbi:MAG: thioredoxin domain-containing protein, partial [Nocardioidaceae bacterium]
MNRLADTASPYLLQHADNPVEWWPWCDEAFVAAGRRDVPVLLSIGYSSCHWCHVMAHESFEDSETAALMNGRFVNIKVDREERPDVDSVYMEATQAMTGQGGWPMTVFCTPAGEPFYCGMYFPRPQFHQVIEAVERAWEERRQDVLEQGQRIVAALTERAPRLGGGPAPDRESLDAAVGVLADGFDERDAGFGGAPKFPPSMVLEFLLRHEARTGDGRSLSMVDRTCETMARGGVYDQLGGGFARYSTDQRWVVPHFEKMLYDNTLLLRAYTHWWRRTGAPLARRVALETADWLLREMRTAQGGFASALDADSEGVEGKYYVWAPAELREALGVDDATWTADLFGVTHEGTFERGTSVLQLRADPDDLERYERVRGALFGVRSKRVRPGRDDKVVAAWNGLAIAALAETGALFDRADLVRAAEETAGLLRDLHMADGRLVRTSRNGVASGNAGVLEDYGDVAEGLLALHAVTGDPEWVRHAGGLLDAVLDHFGDGRGGLYDTADDAERLVRRPQDPTDNASPSGQFAAAGALLSYAALTGSARHREAAEGVLGTVTALADRVPRFVGWGLAVAEALAAAAETGADLVLLVRGGGSRV